MDPGSAPQRVGQAHGADPVGEFRAAPLVCPPRHRGFHRQNDAMLAGSPDHLGGNWIGRLLPKTIAVTVPRITHRRSAGNSFKIQHAFLIN